MSLLTAAPVPQKTVPVFIALDLPAPLSAIKAETINAAISELALAFAQDKRSGVVFKIAVLLSSSQWITPDGPVPASDFIGKPLSGTTGGDLAACLGELNAKLSRKTFMRDPGSFPPLIILIRGAANGIPAEDYKNALSALQKNNWFKSALKLDFVLGKNPGKTALEDFLGPLHASIPEKFKELVLFAGNAAADITAGGLRIDTANAETTSRQHRLNALLKDFCAQANMSADLPVKQPDAEIAVQPKLPEAVDTAAGFSQAVSEWEGVINTGNAALAARAVAYKSTIVKSFISLSPNQIDDHLGGAHYYVTRKYDGELAVLFWNGADCIAINSGGKTYPFLACIGQAAEMLKAAGSREAVIAAELYADESKGRTRVSDVIAALADPGKRAVLQLAPFDIISLDGADFRPNVYADTHRKLRELFHDNLYCTPVRFAEAASKAELKQLFSSWVEKEGGEGLVIHSELPMVYKIKPRLSIDAAVVGFSEGTGETAGQVRTLLYALMTEDGAFQIIGRTGNGLNAEQKKDLYPRLLAMEIRSNYIETDSNHVAFHLIRPGLVVELSVNDVLTENSSGPIMNPLLVYKEDDGSFRRIGNVPGFSFVSAVFERFRDDKTANPQDTRLSQVNSRVFYRHAANPTETEKLPASRILKREVYKKETGTKLMAQKFLVWKTNKEQHGYPAYVMSYTNFSSERSEPVTLDMRVSNDERQIMQLYNEFIGKNVKSGWEKEM